MVQEEDQEYVSMLNEDSRLGLEESENYATVGALLNDTLDQARRNLFKALSQVLLALFIIVFIAFADSPILGVSKLISTFGAETQTAFWAAKWFLLTGACVYTLVSMVHVVMSLSHIREARDLKWRVPR